MSFNIVVLAKQVPDTKNISGKVMKEDGTVNRAALPAIFNPEDLNALEEALKIKEKYGAKVTVITMGPPNAAEILRESLYRGADDVVLISDRKFAGSDTLATSYILSLAIKKLGQFDIILAGRQAIDGDTAQVGPQTAEKLKINQVSSVDKIIEVTTNYVVVEHSLVDGYEVVKTKLPVLLTITSEANTPRPPSVKKILKYKNIVTELEKKNYDEDYIDSDKRKKDFIKVFNIETIGADPAYCGLSGSPTKVKKIESVVLESASVKKIENTEEGYRSLIKELMEEHILG